MNTNLNAAFKSVGSSTSNEGRAAKDHIPDGQSFDGTHRRRGCVVGGTLADGYTVALLDALGELTDKEFERVGAFPGDVTLGAGDYVWLFFETASHPVIETGGAGGGGAGTVDFIVTGESWFLT